MTNVRVGWALLDSYDLKAAKRGGWPFSGRIYRVPLYKMTVTGRSQAGALITKDFKVVRFGVAHNQQGRDPNRDFIAGKSRDPRIHSLTWVKFGAKGAWRLSGYRQVLVHDGVDRRRQVGAGVGCIEVTGPRMWREFNGVVRALAGALDLKRIGDKGVLTLQFQPAPEPRLIRVR